MTNEEVQVLKALVEEYERLCDWYCLHPGKYPERYESLFNAKALLKKEEQGK